LLGEDEPRGGDGSGSSGNEGEGEDRHVEALVRQVRLLEWNERPREDREEGQEGEEGREERPLGIRRSLTRRAHPSRAWLDAGATVPHGTARAGEPGHFPLHCGNMASNDVRRMAGVIVCPLAINSRLSGDWNL